MFKKFFSGLNLMGNKIINAKVDNPSNPEDISNKKYIDDNLTFDTQNANDKGVSPKFPYIGNLNGLKIKDLIDKLLFPVVNPEYVNPKIDKINLYNIGNSINFNGNIIQGEIEVIFNEHDRNSYNNLKITFYSHSQNDLSFQSSNNSNKIIFSLPWNEIYKIEIEQIFTPVNRKQDSEGNDFIDYNFESSFDFKEILDINLFVQTFRINSGIYYKKLVNTTANDFKSQLTSNLLTNQEFYSLLNRGNLFDLEIQNNDDISQKNLLFVVFDKQLLNDKIMIQVLNGETIEISLDYFIKECELEFLRRIEDEEYNSFIDYYYFVYDFGKHNQSKKGLIFIN